MVNLDNLREEELASLHDLAMSFPRGSLKYFQSLVIYHQETCDYWKNRLSNDGSNESDIESVIEGHLGCVKELTFIISEMKHRSNAAKPPNVFDND